MVRVRVSLECLSPSCTKWLGKALTLTITLALALALTLTLPTLPPP